MCKHFASSFKINTSNFIFHLIHILNVTTLIVLTPPIGLVHLILIVPIYLMIMLIHMLIVAIHLLIVSTNLMIVQIPSMISCILLLIQLIPLTDHLQIFGSQIPHFYNYYSWI